MHLTINYGKIKKYLEEKEQGKNKTKKSTKYLEKVLTLLFLYGIIKKYLGTDKKTIDELVKIIDEFIKHIAY